MISENIDRDLVKSQLKEGLKHSRKVLKDKRGRKDWCSRLVTAVSSQQMGHSLQGHTWCFTPSTILLLK